MSKFEEFLASRSIPKDSGVSRLLAETWNAALEAADILEGAAYKSIPEHLGVETLNYGG